MSLRWIDEGLGELRAAGLLRTRRSPFSSPGPWIAGPDGRRLLNLCSNDYLSLAAEPVTGLSGSGASRLVGADLLQHQSLERDLASWLGTEDALVFSSGYAANVGAIAALAAPGSLVVSDALNHASLIDGCRLSRARIAVVPHRDIEAVEGALRSASESRKLVVTDGYFSMDGDLAAVAELRALCDRYGATLYVDEAHALGVFGPRGRGSAAAAEARPDVLMGTLGKAFGASGAFVAGSRALVEWLWNRARSFVFSTGISPVVAAAASRALPLVVEGVRTEKLRSNARLLRAALDLKGVRVAPSVGPILPIPMSSVEGAAAASSRLLELGFFVHPIRPPTVPVGTSRLRVTVQAGHEESDLLRAAEAFAEVVR